MKYIIVEANTLGSLAFGVADRMNEGYKPQGGIAQIGTCVAQAMVKDNE